MNLQIDGIVNIRELGGIKTEDGKKVRCGVLFRSAHLHDISIEGRKLLFKEYQLKHVVDFRDVSECIKKPDLVIPMAKYYCFPVLTNLFGQEETKETKRAFWDKNPRLLFQEIYASMATDEQALEAYRSFFKVLLEANGEAVLWHCTQGKDRTGIAAALLLTVLGASKETIIEEYMLTNKAMQKEYVQMKESGMSEERLSFMSEILFVNKENIEQYYDMIEKEYDNLYTYIIRQLINEEEAVMLRKAYLCE